MKCLEDLGFFCVDNLPPVLIPKFAQLCATSDSNRLALVVRASERTGEVQDAMEQLNSIGFTPKVLFLEADETVLVRRYAESRRRHPRGGSQGVLHGIREERDVLAPLRAQADFLVDTSRLSPHQLNRRLQSLFDHSGPQKMALHLLSFGFKNGTPPDVDFVFDVRFLPNPYYVEELREKCGLDDEVRQYVLDRPATKELLGHITSLLDFVLPQYFAEGRKFLTIGIGCTGGQHRSTSLAEHLADVYREAGHPVSVHHRDMKVKSVQAAS